MGRSVTITTPIPTLEEVGKRLKMSKARQQRIIEIVRGSTPVQFSVRRRDAAVPVDGRSRSKKGNAKLSTPRSVAKVSASSKKIERAAAS
jgi:hypothetical protein